MIRRGWVGAAANDQLPIISGSLGSYSTRFFAIGAHPYLEVQENTSAIMLTSGLADAIINLTTHPTSSAGYK